jgi:ACS family glucarate transporter-like MFS transporter
MSTIASRSLQKPFPAAGVKPTFVRWEIMIMIAVVNMLPSLGKLSFGVAMKFIQEEFRFSTTAVGWMLSAFGVGYALFQIPAGWAGDRFGARKSLSVAMLFYSLCLALMALAPQIPISRWLGLAWLFALIQLGVGAGEAFGPPNAAKVVGSWMSSGKMAFGVSFNSFGIGLGGAVTPLFIAWTMQRWGWRTSFVLSGAIGVLVAVTWALWVTDRPEEHPRINAAELELIRPKGDLAHGRPRKNLTPGPPPWGLMLCRGSIWALFVSYTCRAYTMYFFNSWFYLYLTRARGLTVLRGGMWGAAPFLAILMLSPVGGWFSDFAARAFGKRRGRQAAVWVGTGMSAVLIWIGSHTANTPTAIILVGAAAGFNMFANVTFWTACIDLVPDYAASLSGMMNAFGAVAGFAAPVVTAYVATAFGWAAALDLIAFLSVASGLLWLFVNADEKLKPEQAPIQAAGEYA